MGGSAGKALSLHDQARNAELALQRQEQEETDKERQIEVRVSLSIPTRNSGGIRNMLFGKP